jgi:uncharacterized DUF497 family protein
MLFSFHPWTLDRMPAHIYNVNMPDLTFDWDHRKETANRRKHGVSFEEAQTVFLDENALLTHDPDHSTDEDRFVLLGMSFKLRALVVCHCYRASEAIVGIISARKASRPEQKQYWDRCRT